MARTHASRPGRQRGAALLTAMIIVTLVATLASGMVWQQWRAVQVEAAERARVQAAWILTGALDFAKLILREDQRNTERNRTPTALTEPWATPLAESRLSTFLAVDQANADDGPEAFLSGDITDAQARYNLFNLIPTDNKPDADEQVATLARLCEKAGVETGIAQRIVTGLRDAYATTNAAAPLRPRTVAQLVWLGVDETTVQALAPYVALLPGPSKINVNTASGDVLAAAIKGMDPGSAERIVQIRQRTPFKDLSEFSLQFPNLPTGNLDVRSRYFEVHTRLRLADRVLAERALVERPAQFTATSRSVVLERERVASVEKVGE